MLPEPQPGTRKGRAGSAPLKRSLAWRTAAASLAVAGAAAALYAASPLLRPADSDEGTLRALQVRVLTISQAAAENRMDGALAALEALEKDLNDAAGRGQISLSRYRGIEAAVESVREDITGRIEAVSAAAAEAPAVGTATTAAVPAPVEAQQPVPQPPEPQEPAQPEPQPPVIAPAPAPEPAPVQNEPVSPDPDKEGKGKGKGQGNPRYTSGGQ